MIGTINSTDFKLPGLISRYEGKVRDVYELENEILVIVASDRISAFDIASMDSKCVIKLSALKYIFF